MSTRPPLASPEAWLLGRARPARWQRAHERASGELLVGTGVHLLTFQLRARLGFCGLFRRMLAVEADPLSVASMKRLSAGFVGPGRQLRWWGRRRLGGPGTRHVWF
jgi:hypothetical protein